MKKILFVLTIMFTMALSANAQFYAGGSLGLHANKTGHELAISPEIGYTFQGNTGVGCLFDFAFDKGETKSFGFGVNPYFEYRFLEVDKFTFYVHTYLHYNNFGQDITKVFKSSEDPEFYYAAIQHKAGYNYGVSLCPGVIWGVTDHWSAAFYVGGVEYMWNQPTGTVFKDGTGDFNLGFATNMPFAVALYYSF